MRMEGAPSLFGVETTGKWGFRAQLAGYSVTSCAYPPTSCAVNVPGCVVHASGVSCAMGEFSADAPRG